MSPRQLISAAAAISMLAGPALAQVAPPPPPPSDPEPEFVPPPMPKPRAAPSRPTTTTTTGGGAPRATTNLPNIPHPELWEFCGTEDPTIDDVCRFEDNLHFVALKANPTISPGMVEMIQPVIVGRRTRMEQIVIENLGVAMQVDGGLLEEVGISDPTALQELLTVVKPLTPPTNLTQELHNREILTGTQYRFSNKIIGDYQRAYGEYLRRTDAENATDRFMRSMFEDSMIEATQALDGMLHESRANMDAVLAKVEGVPAPVASALRALKIDSVEVDPSSLHASAEEVKLAWRPLTDDQKKQFLIAVRTSRVNENIPPVPTIDVMHAGKHIVEGEPIRKLDTNNAKKAPGQD